MSLEARTAAIWLNCSLCDGDCCKCKVKQAIERMRSTRTYTNRRVGKEEKKENIDTQKPKPKGWKKTQHPIVHARKLSSPYRFSSSRTLVRVSRPSGCVEITTSQTGFGGPCPRCRTDKQPCLSHHILTVPFILPKRMADLSLCFSARSMLCNT